MNNERILPSRAYESLQLKLEKYKYSRHRMLHAIQDIVIEQSFWKLCILFVHILSTLIYILLWYFSLRNRSRGLMMCDVLFQTVSYILNSYLVHYIQLSERQLVGALQLAVYAKAAKLTSSMTSPAKITVLAANDVRRLSKAVYKVPLVTSLLVVLVPNIALLGMLLNWHIASVVIIIFILAAVLTSAIGRVGRLSRVRVAIYADKRLGMIREMLQHVAIVKMFSWELAFARKVDDLRKHESHDAFKFRILDSVGTMITVSTFGIAGGVAIWLTPPELQTPEVLIVLIGSISFICQSFQGPALSHRDFSVAVVSYRRLAEFLSLPEGGNAVEKLPIDDTGNRREIRKMVRLEGDIYQASGENGPVCCAKNLNVSINSGEFVVVCGSASSGKTSILSAILGQVAPNLATKVKVRGRVGSVMTCWIESGTVRDNIIFGSEFDASFYEEVLNMCCLNLDLDLLPEGDLTELGENGIGLSFGQAARVSLARSLYTCPDVLLIDGVLEATDGLMRQQLVVNLQGFAKQDRVIIITSNDPQVLDAADKIMWLNPETPLVGSLSELLKNEGFLATYSSIVSVPTLIDDDPCARQHCSMAERRDSDEYIDPYSSDESEYEGPRVRFANTVYSKTSELPTQIPSIQSSSSVSRNVLKVGNEEDIRAASIRDLVPLLELSTQPKIAFVLGLALLSVIIGACARALAVLITCAIASRNQLGRPTDRLMKIPLIFQCVLALSIFSVIQLSTFAFDGIARRIHRRTFLNLLHAKMSFFATFPLGRLLTRFTTDLDMVHHQTSRVLQRIFMSGFAILAALLLISWVSSIYFGAIFGITLAAASFLCRNGSREKTLQQQIAQESSARSSYAAEKLDGLQVLVSFDQFDKVLKNIAKRIDDEQLLVERLKTLNAKSERLMAILMYPLLTAVPFIRDPQGSIARLGLLRSLTQYSFREMADMLYFINKWHVCTISLARMRQLEHQTPQEPYKNNHKDMWHARSGSIKFENVCFQYHPAMPYTLQKFSMSAESGEKVGICGRSGVGKSTIFNALFRVSDPTSGRILIDNQDTSKLGIEEVRDALTVLPQRPVLFSGTVRSNLDPFHEYTDQQVKDVLYRANLGRLNLNAKVSGGGANFSESKKQLLALARCFLRRSPIVLLDEPTSSIDPATDRLILQKCNQEFCDRTVLCIAHRLKTILHYDKILVVGVGGVKLEYGPPKQLYRSRGVFWEMCQDSGLSEEDF